MEVAVFVVKVISTICLIYPLLFWLCSTICRFWTFFNIFIVDSKLRVVQNCVAIIRIIFMIRDEPIWDRNPIEGESVFGYLKEVVNFMFGSMLPLFIHIAILVLIW